MSTLPPVIASRESSLVPVTIKTDPAEFILPNPPVIEIEPPCLSADVASIEIGPESELSLVDSDILPASFIESDVLNASPTSFVWALLCEIILISELPEEESANNIKEPDLSDDFVENKTFSEAKKSETTELALKASEVTTIDPPEIATEPSEYPDDTLMS